MNLADDSLRIILGYLGPTAAANFRQASARVCRISTPLDIHIICGGAIGRKYNSWIMRSSTIIWFDILEEIAARAVIDLTAERLWWVRGTFAKQPFRDRPQTIFDDDLVAELIKPAEKMVKVMLFGVAHDRSILFRAKKDLMGRRVAKTRIIHTYWSPCFDTTESPDPGLTVGLLKTGDIMCSRTGDAVTITEKEPIKPEIFNQVQRKDSTRQARAAQKVKVKVPKMKYSRGPAHKTKFR